MLANVGFLLNADTSITLDARKADTMKISKISAKSPFPHLKGFVLPNSTFYSKTFLIGLRKPIKVGI